MASVPLSLRIDSKIKLQLDKEAKDLDRSASYVATKAIKNYLDSRQRKRKAIDMALKEADKGEFISQKAVHAWLDSWGSENELSPPKPDIFLKNK